MWGFVGRYREKERTSNVPCDISSGGVEVSRTVGDKTWRSSEAGLHGDELVEKLEFNSVSVAQ